jgi:VIT1/CCC1 family predicted Fe2+/Mn2+ transporter
MQGRGASLTITGAAADSRLAGGQGSKLGRRALSGLSVFLGALFGSLLIVGGNSSTTLVLALLAAGGVAAGAAIVSRPHSSWAVPA